jgi:uncharacterized protein YwqG
LPEDIRSETGDDDLRTYGNDEYARVHATLLGGESSSKTFVHQLCGAPQEVQSGLFRTCQLASHGDDPVAKDWRLLLQIDSDEDGPGWMWGDNGCLYFCIQ